MGDELPSASGKTAFASMLQNFEQKARLSGPQNATATAPSNASRDTRVAKPISVGISPSSSAAASAKTILVNVYVSGAAQITLHCTPQDTLAKIKEDALGKAGLEKPEEYTIRPSSWSANTSVTEYTPLSEQQYFQSCQEKGHPLHFVVLEKAHEKREKLLKKHIELLMARPARYGSTDEAYIASNRMQSFVREIIPSIRGGLVNIGMNRTKAPYPDNLPTKFPVRVAYDDENAGYKGLFAEHTTKISALIAMAFSKFPGSTMSSSEVSGSASDYCFKVIGRAEYLDGDYELGSIEYIRQCLKNEGKILLRFINKSTLNDGPALDETILDMSVPEQKELRSESVNSWDKMECIQMSDIDRPFSLKIIGIDHINFNVSNYTEAKEAGQIDDADAVPLSITAELYHGDELICPAVSTGICSDNVFPRWNTWLEYNFPISFLPHATRICFTLYAKGYKEDVPLAWVNCQLLDFRHQLQSGVLSMKMWLNDRANPIGTCVGNLSEKQPPILTVEFEQYALPVVLLPKEVKTSAEAIAARLPSPEESREIDRIINEDPLYKMKPEDKRLIWEFRNYCTQYSKALPKFLISVDWTDPNKVQDAHVYLYSWAKPTALEALELLDAKFADARVRAYAVECLEAFDDNEITDYLLQLVQVLKYEPYHDSSLARFLIRRALSCRVKIGHTLFWHLKAEMHVPEICDRYGILLEAYLRGCGMHREELSRQNLAVGELLRVASAVKRASAAERKQVLERELTNIKLPPTFKLPHNPCIEVSGLVVSKCKFMDSKKLPLWLVFNNADKSGDNVYVIFKSGDDLRQDLLTLQLLNIMDKLWKSHGLDFEMAPYGCVATGCENGFIEVVLNSDTIANISKEYGGATAAFAEEPLDQWLRKHNTARDQYDAAVERFIKSCAGYCVATYVLGIGDRHNDNIMLNKRGNLFHIDFGHFLGHFKKWKGIKRERAPFVLTPDFAYVMGGRDSDKFQRFIDISCRAYNILRSKAPMFINLFTMMLSTGIPELQSEDDIVFLQKAFSCELNEKDASVKFTKLVYTCLGTKTTQINNAIHIFAHS
eukprot:TRINITY_DN1469_c0_g2_i1.p1 TRINITY_DN1469_c0_g2~~TRINITY_DN1469_c0_g2_i1.p1  ORF type:complete len:1062 (-),score=220.71 TRINITY_DN1469_c0_g2_i1:385-3570(-)